MGPQHSSVGTWLPCKCHRELWVWVGAAMVCAWGRQCCQRSADQP